MSISVIARIFFYFLGGRATRALLPPPLPQATTLIYTFVVTFKYKGHNI